MFDICAICVNQNDQGKCIKPGETCDEAYDFRLKPVYQAAPEMYEILTEIISGPTSFFVKMPDHLREWACEILSQIEEKEE